MKRKVFWFAAILLLGCLTACDDDRDDKVYYRPLIVTVHTLDDGDYYFERDNGQTLYPSDKSLVPGYEAKERQRAVITFDLLGGGTGYDYDIALLSVRELFTGAAEIVEDPSLLATMGKAPTSLLLTGCNLTEKWMTLCVAYPVEDNSKHGFHLIVNRLEEPEESTEGYLDVELRHDDAEGASEARLDRMTYISFDLTPISSLLENKKGLSLRILTQQNGTKYVRLDLPRKQE